MHPRRLGLVSTRLQYFLSVAQLGSIRRAAQALHIAPSAVSRTIQQLERDFGTPLFERARQRLKLTSAGEILLYHARASATELDRASAFIGDLQGLKRGRSAAVGVLTQSIDSPFYGTILRGIEQGLSGSDYHPVIASGNWRTDDELEALVLLMTRRVDALIVMSGLNPDDYLRRIAADERGRNELRDVVLGLAEDVAGIVEPEKGVVAALLATTQ